MARPFQDKEIVLGVTGSIAAYKACDVASRLVEAGARVRAVLTRSAREFVGPASFEGITGQRVITEMFEPLQNPEIEHISLARRADLFLIAPATANLLAKAAHGMADDWLSTTLLATRAPILFAPAMNTDMYMHPATQGNIALLKQRGCHFVGPGEGMLACRTVGPGRLIDTPAILEAAGPLLCKTKNLQGKRVLITSGANHEPIDPVRFLGNSSSGRMGRALAFEAL
ncbi:MAG: bifunctional phosphopantothenoylcysteine decarboxylase/phosphopantothenate--cysteine ligase CoaBC, partial [Candidatus Hydrogenedentes bacterium]|nr:bifunctional phosphopantothenoylcysteine decarboxylase/phosphopantothenate--cysteine ligase CoaBC [Candidatus Hydrogenedentota bacterium]